MRLIRLIFSAGKEWERITTTGNYSFFFVLCVSLLPLLALACFGEGWGLMRFGEASSELGRIVVPPERIIRYELFYAGSTLSAIIVGALLLQAVGTSFNVNVPFSAYFALLAYGFLPIIFMHLLDGLPFIHTWICWAIGVGLAVRILYHGVAFALKPEQTKGFGLMIMSVIYVVTLSGLVHFAAVQVLHGRLLRG